jgi:ribonuclease P protein component
MKNTPITENHLFKKAYSKGAKAAGRYTVVYILKDLANKRVVRADPLHRPVNRLGLTVGKKLGGAVERSRARRLMRESYRLILADPAFEVSTGFLLVIAARSAIGSAGCPEVKSDLVASMRRLGILKLSGRSPESCPNERQEDQRGGSGGSAEQPLKK